MKILKIQKQSPPPQAVELTPAPIITKLKRNEMKTSKHKKGTVNKLKRRGMIPLAMKISEIPKHLKGKEMKY
jgi:hypothetical protein